MPTIFHRLSPRQELALGIIEQHHLGLPSSPSLRMIIQGTIGTGKSFLIDRILRALNRSSSQKMNHLLILAPKRVVAYNVRASIVHTTLRIPIKDMNPLKWKPLTIFQEDFKHINYILIDEMSFLGSKLLLKIDSQLWQACLGRNFHPLGGVSIILMGDLAQLPPIMENPIYSSQSILLGLWHTFNIVGMLETIFHQHGQYESQQQFCMLLVNIRNCKASLADWKLLMNQTKSMLVSKKN